MSVQVVTQVTPHGRAQVGTGAADRQARNVFEYSIDLSKLIQMPSFKNRKHCLPSLKKLLYIHV
jgi:hypothetical protein